MSGKDSDDVIQPFQLEASSLRGRSVRLGSLLDEVLAAHDYPEPVAHLVAETMVAALLLSYMLNFEGIFTLQASGDGPVKMLVADVTSDGAVRGCAAFDEERLQHAREQIEALKTTESGRNHLAQYLGKGHIAFTVDQGGPGQRHQGIIELKGSSLIDCVQHYFTQSEHIGTGVKLAIGRRGGHWRAGGIMMQHMPEDRLNPQAGAGNTQEDDWRRTMILLDSCTEDELLDPDLHQNELLVRLFHEEGVRVFEPEPVHKECRCNTGKVEHILLTMDQEELDYIAKDGEIAMTCEFCSQDFVFELSDIQSKLKARNRELID